MEFNFWFKIDYGCKGVPSIKKGERGSRQQNIIDRKVITAANKQKKEVEKLEKAKIAVERRSVKAAEMQLRKEAREAMKVYRQQ